MTALERARAFVNSRAAKTALKIMPLAVAAVVTVGVAPTAKADVVLTPTGAKFTAACMGLSNCSGSFAQRSSSASFTPLSSSMGVTGAEGSGTAAGEFATTPVDHDFPWDFTLTGTGAGQSFFDAGINSLTVSWSFSFPNSDPATGVDDGIFPGINTPKLIFTWSDATHTDVTTQCQPVMFTDSCVVSGLNNSNIDVFTAWSAQLEVPVFSDSGVGKMNWKLDYLDVNANGHQTPTPGVPEPASMLLALTGLPLIGRFIRRKK